MLNNTIKNISQLNQLFDVGQKVYYSCLIINYAWFDKTLSLEEIVEPIITTIIRHKLYPANLQKSDNILISNIGISNIIRKYDFYIYLEEDDIKMTIYEARSKEIYILHESNKIIGYDKDEVQFEFMKLVISTKRDIDNDIENTIILNDMNYELFQSLYQEAVEMYPEEIIKSHNSKNLNLL
jgi:hypothetical protein